ncbi:hypothetical protein K431DRAFT_107302 [Polychaeton citri CBS 116435]|uniref:Uncharacterized protein n=1 Tax=Polychaeton citri CBS 116435 TaxID=1314669 RepID=A0A9P4Q742_9PEZI|nr:hypothetical protein K431DRAFT_107302 [Polychaeton citri CBS 116435]
MLVAPPPRMPQPSLLPPLHVHAALLERAACLVLEVLPLVCQGVIVVILVSWGPSSILAWYFGWRELHCRSLAVVARCDPSWEQTVVAVCRRKRVPFPKHCFLYDTHEEPVVLCSTTFRRSCFGDTRYV